MRESSETISIIITTRNEEYNLARCLESIKKQSYPQGKIEIIVVDNNSSDKTKEIAKAYTGKVYNFGPERSAQRNYGVKQAQGNYILYLDADMALSENVIRECAEKCEREHCIALYIPERIVGRNFWAKARDFERSFYNATCVDCARFIRRDKFLEIGGFDESLTGPEDWDLDKRIRDIGKTGIILPPLYHSEDNFALREYIRKKTYYAGSFGRYIAKWGRGDKVIKKQFGFYYRLFGIFTENRKWTRLIMHPILGVKMYFLRFLVALAYFAKR